MTLSAKTLSQLVLDSPIVEINSVTALSAPNAVIVSARHSECSSRVTKSGFSHIVDVNVGASLTDGVLKTITTQQLRIHHLNMQNNNDPFTIKNCIRHTAILTNGSAVGEGEVESLSTEDVAVDVVSATSGDLSTLHRSLWQTAQGNGDLDDATPVEPFVQELVQWKKTNSRTRPKKTRQGSLLLAISTKRKRSQSPSRCKKLKFCAVDNCRTSAASSVASPSVSKRRVPPIRTLCSMPDKSRELRNYCNGLSSNSNALTSSYNNSNNIAITRPNDLVESLSVTKRGLTNPIRSLTCPSSSNLLLPLSHQPDSQQASPSLATAHLAFAKADTQNTISLSKSARPSMVGANEAKETQVEKETVSSVPEGLFFDTVEVVDLELEESDIDEGEELLLADTGADLASAVQFVELRPDDIIRDKGSATANDESQAEEISTTGDTSRSEEESIAVDPEERKTVLGTLWSERLVRDTNEDSVRYGRNCGDWRGSDKGPKEMKTLTASKDGCEKILLALSSAASKKRVRTRVTKYVATTVTTDRSEGSHFLANRGEESRVKWQHILQGNTFSERKASTHSEGSRPISKCSSEGLHDLWSTARDTPITERLQEDKSPVDQIKVLPMNYCKTQSSNSITRLIKRGKHWFKKIIPAPLISHESERANNDGSITSVTDSLPQNRNVTLTRHGNSLLNSSVQTEGKDHQIPPLNAPKLPFQHPPLPSLEIARLIIEPTIPASIDSGARIAGAPADHVITWPSADCAIQRPSHGSSSPHLTQEIPEVQFVAIDDGTEVGYDSVTEETSHTDDCDPLGGETEDPLSCDRNTVHAGQDPHFDVALRGESSSLKRDNLVNSKPTENSCSDLGSFLSSGSFYTSTHQIKSELLEGVSSYSNIIDSLEESKINNSNINPSRKGTVNDCSSKETSDESLALSNQGVELPPPPGMSVRHYNLTDDAVHFHQSKQIIIDPKKMHRITNGPNNRLPGVCDAEDYIMKNFSSNNYAFCEVDPKTSRLPRGLHRFSLQVKGNRVYRSSKPCQTFRIEVATSHDQLIGSLSTDGTAATGDSRTLSSDGALPSDGAADLNESSSSYPRISSSGGLVMRNPHEELKSHLLANSRLHQLHKELQRIQKTENAARLALKCSRHGPPSPEHGAAVQELYSKRVHIQVHFYKVLNYLKVSWFREKVRQAQSRAEANNTSTGHDAS